MALSKLDHAQGRFGSQKVTPQLDAAARRYIVRLKQVDPEPLPTGVLRAFDVSRARAKDLPLFERMADLVWDRLGWGRKRRARPE